MLQLLFYMNVMGILFYLLHLLFLPLEKKCMPPDYRVFIYRLNLIFFIVPLPVCLFYLRRCLDNYILNLPVSPFYNSGTHIIVHIGKIGFVLPTMNNFEIFLILLWTGVVIIKYRKFIEKNRKFRSLNSSLSLLQKEEISYSFNINSLVNTAMKELGIKKNPRILLQENLISPHVSGIFRTTLCLPCHWDVPESVYYMAIKHELAHVRHKDLLFQRISLIAKIICWFNPFLYLLCSNIEACEELAADASACDGASRSDCIAYQTAILELSALTSDKPQTSIKELGFQRKRKNFTIERILTMKNKNLHKYKPLKLTTTILVSVVLFSLSSVPALAYTLPSAVRNLIIDPIDMIEVNLLQSEINSTSSSFSIQAVENDVNSLFRNINFSDNNLVYSDENGNIFSGTTYPQNTSCSHSYLVTQTAHHAPNSDGSCSITYYNAKRCVKCNYIVLQDQDCIATTTYDLCPHYSTQ